MTKKNRSERGGKKRLLAPVLAMGMVAGGVLSFGSTPAYANVGDVGYACGYYSNVSLGGGPYGSMGCGTQTSIYATANSASPSVTLQANGAMQYLSDIDGAKAVYGPAVMFSSPYTPSDTTTNSGELNAYTAGGSSVTSQAKAFAVGPSPFWTQTPASAVPYAEPAKSQTAAGGIHAYDNSVGYALGQCSASGPLNKSGLGSIKNGRVDTHTDTAGNPTATVVVPANADNLRINFWVESVGPEEHGHMVFNEKILNADGSITVNAAHMYMEGPFAFGDVIIGQVKCGRVA